MTDAVRPAAVVPAVGLRDLFVGFLQVSLCAFGGGLPWARHQVVVRKHWLDEQEFADILSLCQFMPGPNIASVTVCVGARLRGIPGAFASLAGFIVIPWMIGFALGAWYLHYAHVTVLQNILHGVSAAAAGMIMAVGIRLFSPHRRRPAALLFAVLSFAALAFGHLPLLVVVAVLAPLSIGAACLERRRAR